MFVFVKILNTPHPVHVGSRVQKRRDTGNLYIVVIPRYIVDEPVEGRVILFVFDVKIGACRDRTTKSVHIK